jgi:hypothetical protein
VVISATTQRRRTPMTFYSGLVQPRDIHCTSRKKILDNSRRIRRRDLTPLNIEFP